MKICVSGAGPSGLAGIRSLRDAGLVAGAVQDRRPEVGEDRLLDGESRHTCVPGSADIISPRGFSPHEGAPVPDAYSKYPAQEVRAQYPGTCTPYLELQPHIPWNAPPGSGVRAGRGRRCR